MATKLGCLASGYLARLLENQYFNQTFNYLYGNKKKSMRYVLDIKAKKMRTENFSVLIF